MELKLAQAGVLISALAASLPLILIRVARDKAKANEDGASLQYLTLLQLRFLISAAAAVIIPSLLLALVPQMAADFNQPMIHQVAVAISWLPSLVFGSLAVLMFVFGVEGFGFSHPDRAPPKRQPSALRWLAWAIVTVSAAVVALGPWSLVELTQIAKEYPGWHFGWSLTVVAAGFYAVAPIWRTFWK